MSFVSEVEVLMLSHRVTIKWDKLWKIIVKQVGPQSVFIVTIGNILFGSSITVSVESLQKWRPKKCNKEGWC
jgi:hypothetical protein